MHHHSDPAGSRLPACTVLDIIDGKPWKARAIRNNNLRQHCHVLARTFRSDPLTNPRFRPAMRDLLRAVIDRSNLLETTHPSQFQLVPILTRIAAYSANWLKPPQEWICSNGMADTQLHSLTAHLFERYPVPAVFKNAWSVKGEPRYLERDWYCRIARGDSLRSAPGFPPSITARALHVAMQAPDHLTIRQALRWGQLKAVAAPGDLRAEVLASRMVNDLSNDGVWSRLIEKMSAAKDRRPGDFGLISDAMLCFFAESKLLHPCALAGLPYPDLSRHCRAFWQTILDGAISDGLARPDQSVRCPHLRRMLHDHYFAVTQPFLPRPSDSGEDSSPEVEWRMVELIHHHELISEGRTMKHCVGSYWKKCRSQKSAIFSLRVYRTEDRISRVRRLFTIEVDRASKRIIQIRAKQNRYVRAVDVPEIAEWAERHHLSYR